MGLNMILRMIFSVVEMSMYSITVLILCGIKQKDIPRSILVIAVSAIAIFNLIPSGGALYLMPVIAILAYWLTNSTLIKTISYFIMTIFISMGSNLILFLISKSISVNLEEFNILFATLAILISSTGYCLMIKEKIYVYVVDYRKQRKENNSTNQKRKSSKVNNGCIRESIRLFNIVFNRS